MTNKEKFRYAFKLSAVASTGLSFIEDSLSRIMNDGTDLAYLRSFYILLSYNFELILKSRIVMVSDFPDKEAIKTKLKKLSHNILQITKTLGKSVLKDVGIRGVGRSNGQYRIVTDNGEIFVEDFTNIRYDFLTDRIRFVSHQEHERINKHVKTMRLLLQKVKIKNEADGLI